MASSPNRTSFQPATWHAAVILGLFTALFFAKILFGKAFLWEDFLEQEIPYRVFAAHCLGHGTFPLWNPYTFCGMPFFAELQTAVLYPTNLLLTFLISPGSLGTWWIEFFIIAHFWLAAFGMYILCRRGFAQSAWASLFAGIAYGFSGMMVTHAIHQGMIFQFAWLPWVLGCMLHGARHRETRMFILAGVLLGLSLLAGHPQITLYTFTGLGIIFIPMIWNTVRADRAQGMKHGAALGARALATIVIAVGIFAVQYIPSVELADRVVRSEVTYEFASEGSLQWSQLVTAFVPKFFGSSEAVQSKLPFWLNEGRQYFLFWETCFYCGVITLLLAAVGMLRGKKMPMRGTLIGVGAFAVAYALGENFVVFPALFQLPLFNKFRDPARIMYLFTFAAAIFAGRGIDLLIEQRAKLFVKKTALYVWAGVGVGFGVVLASMGMSMLDVPEQLASAVSAHVWTFVALWVAAVFVLWQMERAPAKPVVVGAIVVLAIDLFLFGGGINNGARDPKAAYNTYPEVLNKLRSESQNQLFRIRMREGSAMLMQRNQGPVDKLFLIEGYSPLVLQRHIPVMASQADQADLMNVRYEVAVDSARRGMSMRERQNFMPRAFIVHRATVLGDSAVMRAVKQPFEFRSMVYLEKAPGVALPDSSVPATGSASITAYDVNAITVRAESAENGILVTGEIDYPGWSATIDGQPVEVLRANSCLRAVALPKGTHTVVFTFAPPSFSSAGMLSLGVLIVSVLGIVVLSVKKRGTSV